MGARFRWRHRVGVIDLKLGCSIAQGTETFPTTRKSCLSALCSRTGVLKRAADWIPPRVRLTSGSLPQNRFRPRQFGPLVLTRWKLRLRYLRTGANGQAAKPVEILERYSEGEEQGLKPESDRKLRKMLRFHLRDRLTSGLAAGSQTNGQNLATGSANFRVTHRTIDALLEGLKDLDGDPTVK